MTTARIQPAGIPALHVLAALHDACFDEAWSVDLLGRILASPGGFALLARADDAEGRPLGFALCRAGGGECELLSLGVAAAERGQGTARALLAAAVAEARRLGAMALFLEVAEDNAAARALYGAAGFRQVGRRPRYYPRPDAAIDALVLRLDLTG